MKEPGGPGASLDDHPSETAVSLLVMSASVLAAQDLQQIFMEIQSKTSFGCSTVISGFVTV